MEIIIKVFISSMLLNLGLLIAGKILLDSDEKILNYKTIIFSISTAILITFTHLTITNSSKVIFVFLGFIMLSKMIFKKEISKSLVLSALYYITMMISECIAVLPIIIIYSILELGSVDSMKNTISISIVITFLTVYIIKKFKNKYKNILEKMQNNKTIILAILSILILICLYSLYRKIELTGWRLSSEYILDTIIIIVISIIGIMVIKQRVNYEKIENQYKSLAKYSETNASLLEEYSMLNHEYKNQLIIIKGMIATEDKELAQYVQTLLDKKDNIKFKWIRDLNNITFQGLKSFMNYKILEMKNEKLNVYVSVSKECKNYKLEKMSTIDKDKIYSIIGVYLDNAKEAAKISKEKEININIYVNCNNFYFEIANTYEGILEIEKLNNYGYTSKGKGHGTGLYLIQNIVKDSDKFKTHTRIENNFFIQTLIVKI